MSDRTLSGGAVCDIEYVYAGIERDRVFWEEPCADVTAKMVDRAELEELDDWERLDGFQQGFVEAMPGGLVLYVSGTFSAAVYPVDTTNRTIAVWVSD